ncbi:MAG: hypothetical protein K1X92_05560 [Bacteroidia bacterium]|nr:hypothetical protein [Bacteroidia bacterium]
MDLTTSVSEALLYSVPAALVVVAVRIVLYWQKDKDDQDQKYKLKADIIKNNFALKLSAYERCVLFLERISPQHLFTTNIPAGKTAEQYYRELEYIINSEYEHNITQQIYISPQAWIALVKGKEDLLSILRNVKNNLPANADGFALANSAVKFLEEQQAFPTQSAILVLKTESNGLFSL